MCPKEIKERGGVLPSAKVPDADLLKDFFDKEGRKKRLRFSIRRHTGRPLVSQLALHP
jgi:hypothetical protein